MKSTIITELFDRKGKLKKRKEQPAHSFVFSIIKMLYVHFAQSWMNLTDVFGDARSVNTDSASDTYLQNNFLLSSITGNSLLPIAWGGTGNYDPDQHSGDRYGIQIGEGDTAVGATDSKLETRFKHKPSQVLTNFTQEFYITGDTVDYEIHGLLWKGQKWKDIHFYASYHQAHMYIVGVKLKLWKEGTPPNNIVVDLTTDADKNTVLATAELTPAQITSTSAPGDWFTFTFTAPYKFHWHRVDMHLRVHQKNNDGDTDNCYHWRYDSTGDYANGYLTYSNDGGVGWSYNVSYDYMFQIMMSTLGDFKYGGCWCDDITFSNPNGEFSIIRRFKNVSGGSKDVKEVGLYAAGVKKTEPGYPFLIARDVLVSPVTVLDDEILQVTYKIKITV